MLVFVRERYAWLFSLVLMLLVFGSSPGHSETWREYQAKLQFCAAQLQNLNGQLEYAELQKLAKIVDRLFEDGEADLTPQQRQFIRDLQNRPNFPNDLLDKVLKTAAAENLMFQKPEQDLVIHAHTGFGSLPVPSGTSGEAQPTQPERQPSVWRPLRMWLYILAGLHVYNYYAKQALPDVREATRIVSMEGTLNSLRREQVTMLRQSDFESQLAAIFESNAFPEEIHLSRNLSDSSELLRLRKINEGGTEARKSASYSFKIGGNSLRYPLEIIEIERFENYRGEGRLLTIQIGAIVSDEPKATWVYTPDKGLQLAPISEQ